MTDSLPQFLPEDHLSYLTTLARVLRDDSRGRLRQHLEVEDLVQEAVTKSHSRQAQFSGSTAEEFRAWLRRILENEFKDKVRYWLRDKRNLDRDRTYLESLDGSHSQAYEIPTSGQTSPSSYLDRHEFRLRLVAALHTLPDEQRMAVELHHYQGCKLAEVAARMQRSKPSIAGLIRRGMETLREQLDVNHK